ncbi:hypothetical protein RSAG8_12888, partial [Rhizoctonia solani AG-8 WAC10335]
APRGFSFPPPFQLGLFEQTFETDWILSIEKKVLRAIFQCISGFLSFIYIWY